MIDHESHLKQVIANQRTLASEIQELNTTIAIKKEQFLKLQGILEYLEANGIKPESNEQVDDTELQSTESGDAE